MTTTEALLERIKAILWDEIEADEGGSVYGYDNAAEKVMEEIALARPGVREAEERELIQQLWAALNFILAFYEPQNYLDTEAWKQAEAGGRRAHKAAREYLDRPALTSPPAEALAGEAKGHDPKLAASLRDVAASLSSRPPELRGPFNVKSTSAPKEGEPTAEQVERGANGPVRLNYEASLHLNWIADRLEHVHGENPNYDYMHRLREIAAALKAAGVSADTRVSEDEARQLLVAGWNACRKSIYAVCEDVDREAEETYLAASKSGSPTSTEGHLSEFQSGHVSGYRSGMVRASKSIARGFNSMEALDDDNLKKALEAALTVKGGEADA